MLDSPGWIELYEDFVSEIEPTKLKAQLEALETAIFNRLLQLRDTPEDRYEVRAIKMAADKLLEIKTQKLGSPPLPGAGGSGTISSRPTHRKSDVRAA